MTNALKRAIRTFVQAFLGSILTSGVLSAIAVQGIVDYSVLKKVAASALAAGLIALITYAMNALEDHEIIPALLKNVPQEPDAAEADDQIVDLPPAEFPSGLVTKEKPVVVRKVPAPPKTAAKKAVPVKKAAKKPQP